MDRLHLTAPRVVMLGTFPPTQCGLATFGAALAAAMSAGQARPPVEIVEVVDEPHPSPPHVVCQVVRGDDDSLVEGRRWLHKYDAVIVQHEFGIFGGRDGDEVLELLRDIDVPVVVVLHTVLSQPGAYQRHVIEELVSIASAVVVMTTAAQTQLIRRFRVDIRKLRVIPHGAHENPAQPSDPRHRSHQTILTWGLLGPGKGLELGIDALADLRDLIPAPRYVIAGQTHPKVKAAHGEAYRRSLVERTVTAGVDHLVDFDDSYRDVASLNTLIRSADVVVVPYESRDQVTSGVLIEAVASGRPVVATDFPHARELLNSGAGIVVPHQSPQAMADALRRVLTHHRLAARMRAEAECISAPMMWPVVGRRYCELIDELVSEKASRPCAA